MAKKATKTAPKAPAKKAMPAKKPMPAKKAAFGKAKAAY